VGRRVKSPRRILRLWFSRYVKGRSWSPQAYPSRPLRPPPPNPTVSLETFYHYLPLSLVLFRIVRGLKDSSCAFYAFCAVPWCGDSRLGKVQDRPKIPLHKPIVAVGSSPLSHSIAYKGFFDKLVTVTTPGSETSVSRRLFQVTEVWGTKGKAGFSRDAQKAQ
jgi:hypothetical protein